MPAAKRKRKSREKMPVSLAVLKKWVPPVFLLCFFLFSVFFVCYVIFFRIVLAQEIGESKPDRSTTVEENNTPITRIVEKRVVPVIMKPRIAIIIDDMGNDKKLGQKFLDLDMDLNFSFLPFAPFTSELEEIAYQSGRTILLHLPLEPENEKWDPGPGALYVSMGNEKAREQFELDLQKVPHATGINNHMGSFYTENEAAMKNLLTIIKEKELFYVDSYTSPRSTGSRLAAAAGVKTARRSVFLDNIHERGVVCEQLGNLVEIAEQKGKAIGIGHPVKETLEGLSGCMGQYHSRVDIVSVRELLE